jgi:threonine/homoserine/homoserine lactone efflux protein
VFLIVLGIQALLRAHRGEELPEPPARTTRKAFRDAVVTSLANPKLSVFFVALFPQFVPDGAPVLPLTVLMGVLVVTIDFAWYSLLALLVTRAQSAVRAPVERLLERVTGSVLVAFGVRLALANRV